MTEPDGFPELPKPIPIFTPTISFSNIFTGENAQPSLNSVLPQVAKAEKSKCSICHEPGDGYHFGAEACRACAAFFRRSIALEKQYICRSHGNCEITANIRCMCRACRYSKCLEVGMNPAGVQQRRDTLGKRIDGPSEHKQNLASLLKGSIDEPSSSSYSAPSISEMMPILERMRQNYAKMDNARLIIHRKEGQSLFGKRTPRSLNYKEAAEVLKKEVTMVADWISWCFDEVSEVHLDQKKVLFRNFFVGYSMMQNAYLSHINNRKDVVILASGDYIDVTNLQNFYFDPEQKEQKMTPEEIEKMFHPGFDIHRRNLILPIMELNIDEYEFFTLAAMIFWDFGLDGQSEECTEVGKKVRGKVLKELSFYYQIIKKYEEPAIRMANVFSILPAVQRSVRRLQEDISINHIFKIFAPPDDFYNIVNGKFC